LVVIAAEKTGLSMADEGEVSQTKLPVVRLHDKAVAPRATLRP
jgi:hypothetical protein